MTRLFKLLDMFAALAAIFIITVAAFHYLISRGDAERRKKARNLILFAIAGYLIIAVIFPLLVNILTGTFGRII